MGKAALGILAILLAGVLFVFQNMDSLPFDIRPTVVPVPAPPMPAECRESIETIRNMSIESRDAAELARFFTAFAEAVDNDTEIDSSETVRKLNIWSGRLMLENKGLYGKYPALSGKVDEIIAASIGSRRLADGFEPVEIDVAKKASLAQALRAVAWAVNN